MSNCCDNKSSLRREKFQQAGKIPSFSSSLLDEICRSIDDSDRKQEKLSSMKKKKKQSNNGGFNTKSRTDDEDEVFSFRKAYLIENWMDKKVSEKTVTRKSYNSPVNDTLFFTPSTSCSDSSSGEFSSENEFLSGGKLMGSSCFPHSSPKPKPIRTSVSNRSPVTEINRDALFSKNQSHINGNEESDNTIKSKLRALKIYKNLKKLKQPISPGLRLTTFLNSIFASKKQKEMKINRSFDQLGIDKSTPKSTCSSVSSFSRSCLSKSSSTREKLGGNGNGGKKTVTFHLDSKFSGPKSVDRKKMIQIPTPICSKPLNRATMMEHEELSFRVMMEKNETRQNETRQRTNVSVNGGNYENGGDDDGDAMSDSSSDLFELDNLEFIGEKYKHCGELPVYETTRVFYNRVIR